VSISVVVVIVAVVLIGGIRVARVRRTGKAFWWSKGKHDG
jgi:hypothetical protein